MSTCLTIMAFVFGAFGIWGPVEQPDGKGGIHIYTYTQEAEECLSVDHALRFIVSNDAPGNPPESTTYFCRVK